MLIRTGTVQVAVTTAGFTAMFFIIIALVAVLAMGYGRRPDWPRQPRARDNKPPRAPRQVPRAKVNGGGKYGVSKSPDKITVEVNPGKCARFGFCEHEAPDVFKLESDGRFGYQASVPVTRMEAVISAMDVCPRRAITVKLPKAHAEARMRPGAPPDDAHRTVIPIFGERDRGDGGQPPRRA